MNPNRKKLPLPPGSPAAKSRKTLWLPASFFALLLAAIGIYATINSSDVIESVNATVEGEFTKVIIPLNGSVKYVAHSGQQVSSGETILKMDSVEYEADYEKSETLINDAAASIPSPSRRLMLQYLSIPGSEAELAAGIEEAAKAENALKELYDGQVSKQAIFALELRKLELKRNKLAEEESRMEAMRIEENLARESLKQNYAEYESTSLERSKLERSLDKKRSLRRALQALPASDREQLYALEKEFIKMYEAQRNIELARVKSPGQGKILFTVTAPGLPAKAGDIAAYFLPDGERLWFIALFSANDTPKIEKNMPCTIILDGTSNVTVKGTIKEELGVLQGRSGYAYKIAVDDADSGMLHGIDPYGNFRVIIEK